MELTSDCFFRFYASSGHKKSESSRQFLDLHSHYTDQKQKRKRKHSVPVSNELQCQHPNIIISSDINDIPVKKRKTYGK